MSRDWPIRTTWRFIGFRGEFVILDEHILVLNFEMFLAEISASACGLHKDSFNLDRESILFLVLFARHVAP